MPDRRRPGRREALRSRVVLWLKIGLPLLALAMLSTLFLLSRSSEQAVLTNFDPARAPSGEAREAIREPSFSGISPRGDLLTMTAGSVWPGKDGSIEAVRVATAMALNDGSRIEMVAAQARVSEADRRVTLSGGVSIDSSTGYRLETETVIAMLDAIAVEAPGPVTGEGPAGMLEAGAMRIERADADADDRVRLLFTDGVRLVYTP
jgi:lipopolysaccharide export system protein LptC